MRDEGDYHDGDPVVVIAVVEWGDSAPLRERSDSELNSSRKYRFRRTDLLPPPTEDDARAAIWSGGGVDGGATVRAQQRASGSLVDQKRNSSSPSSSSAATSAVSYTGLQLHAAIARRALKEMESESSRDATADASNDEEASSKAAKIWESSIVRVEAYDRLSGRFVPLLNDGIRDSNVASRFGRLVRCAIFSLADEDDEEGSSSAASQLSASSASFERRIRVRGGGEDEDGDEAAASVVTPLAIQGRLFPFDPNGIEFAGRRVVVREVPNNGCNGTGLNVWDGSLLLARYLETRPEKVRSKRVLELGSGCGLVGIAAALLGADEVVMTDLPYALPHMKENVESNAGGISDAGCRRIDCLPCDWFDPPPMEFFAFSPARQASCRPSEATGVADVVLVADCVWLEDLVAPLLKTVKCVLKDSLADVNVLISYQRRGKVAHDVFVRGLHQSFSRVECADVESLGLPNSDVLFLFECLK